jgi:hypothetical protein
MGGSDPRGSTIIYFATAEEPYCGKGPSKIFQLAANNETLEHSTVIVGERSCEMCPVESSRSVTRGEQDLSAIVAKNRDCEMCPAETLQSANNDKKGRQVLVEEEQGCEMPPAHALQAANKEEQGHAHAAERSNKVPLDRTFPLVPTIALMIEEDHPAVNAGDQICEMPPPPTYQSGSNNENPKHPAFKNYVEALTLHSSRANSRTIACTICDPEQPVCTCEDADRPTDMDKRRRSRATRKYVA